MIHTITRLVRWSCLLMLMTVYLGSSATAPHGSGSPTLPDPDALALTKLGEQARQHAREAFPDMILLQVYIDLTQTAFRFRDRTEQTEIQVLVPTSATPADHWPVHSDPLLISGPGIDLQQLLVGPNRAATAMLAYWPSCTRSGLGLTLFSQEAQLVWDISCTTAVGVVKGNVDNQTGIFQLTSGPALPPPTALPLAVTATLATNSPLPMSQDAVIKPTPQPKQIGETLDIGTLAVTIHGIQQLAQPSEVNQAIAVDLSIENTAGTVIDLFLCRIHVRDTDGVYYIGDFMPPEFVPGTGLQAQKRIRGRVLFQVPTTATGLSLEIFGLQHNGISGPYFTMAIPQSG